MSRTAAILSDCFPAKRAARKSHAILDLVTDDPGMGKFTKKSPPIDFSTIPEIDKASVLIKTNYEENSSDKDSTKKQAKGHLYKPPKEHMKNARGENFKFITDRSKSLYPEIDSDSCSTLQRAKSTIETRESSSSKPNENKRKGRKKQKRLNDEPAVSKKVKVNASKEKSEAQFLGLLNTETQETEYFKLYTDIQVGLADTIPEDAKDLKADDDYETSSEQAENAQLNIEDILEELGAGYKENKKKLCGKVKNFIKYCEYEQE